MDVSAAIERGLSVRAMRSKPGPDRERRTFPMLLHSLLQQLDSQLSHTGVPNPEIKAVREDSRLVQPGDLFVARAGTKADGQKFVQDAVTRGAVAIVSGGASSKGAVPTIGVLYP